jgi:pyruvate dehydrogenase phosphatase
MASQNTGIVRNIVHCDWLVQTLYRLNQVYMVGNGTPLRKAPLTLKTPPYVTAKPVVIHRKVDFEDPGSLRFLVIATDGLWDALR